MAKSYYLWRQYPEEPFDRYAFTVEFDPTAEDNFRVTDVNPEVSDPGFMHEFAEHMSRPAPGGDSETVGGVIQEFINWHRPGTADHFGAAVRQFPLARISGKGRP